MLHCDRAMVEASGMRMMHTYTTLIPSPFTRTTQRLHHLPLSVSRRHHNLHFSISATTTNAPATPSVVMETIPWGCEIDSLETASSLLKWLSDSGLPPQKMDIGIVDVGERGLVASKNIRKGEKLLFLPPSLVITPDSEWSCPEAGEVLKRNSVPDWPLLATYLISEASLMESSRWSNYISALPRQPYSLLYWSQAELDRYLEASQIRERAMERINNVIGTYNDMRLRIFSKYPDFFPEEVFNIESFKWSFGILFSRMVRLPSMDGKVALVPWADMLNHSCDVETFLDYDKSSKGIVFTTDRTYQPGNMRALDGLQGPMYVGTGCMFRRYALYGFEPPRFIEHTGVFGRVKTKVNRNALQMRSNVDDDTEPLTADSDMGFPQKFGNSTMFTDSIPVAEFQARPLADHKSVKNGRPPGALLMPRPPLDAPTVAEAIAVISCWFEEKTEWGDRIGWIYGSVTEDVVTGYRMHNRRWRSIYCITKRDAFRGTAPINLTDRLHQVLRWATGSVEIFFSKNNALFASRRLKFLQRVAYLNVGIYPFTSIFLVTYCFLPALSLFSGKFIVQGLDVAFLTYLLLITVCLCLISLLEVRWSGIGLEEWWRNEQFWVIGGSSAHLVAVVQGLLKVIAGIEISFTLTSKSSGDDEDDVYADLYMVKWTSLFIMPLTIIIINIIALIMGFLRTVYSVIPQWNKLLGSTFFSFWVLSHMYPFAKGLMGRRGRVPTIVYVWSGLLSITIALLWISIDPPTDTMAAGNIEI